MCQELRVGVADPKEGCYASSPVEPGREDDKGSSVLPAGFEVRFVPLDASWVGEVEALEARVMGSDAWNAAQIIDDLPRSDRTWWAAFLTSDAAKRTVEHGSDTLIGYAGGWIVDGGVQILKVATDPRYRRLGIAARSLSRSHSMRVTWAHMRCRLKCASRTQEHIVSMKSWA